MSKNDDAILKLKTTIDERRKAIGVKKRFSPITSCSLELDGQRYNLHVQSKDQLIYLYCKLHSLEMAATDLKIPDELVISGFSVADWLTDISSKLDVMAQKAQEDQLKVLEAKLDKLLSADKRTELEIAEIAALLESQ